MSILLERGNRVLIQGITGKMGRFSADDLRAYGTRVVAGVVPGRGGGQLDDLPIYDTVREAQQATGADTALVYVPAGGALDAVGEAIEGGCRLVVYPGDGLPARDAIAMRWLARDAGAVVVGPNTPGLISPGKAKCGFMPSHCFMPGPLGVISRSGSLSYEVCKRLTLAGLGQSTVVGIGGDPVKGLTAAEALARFHDDPETRAIVFVGEIGGTDENELGAYARRPDAKPCAAVVVGRAAPPGRRMGHAAALIGSAGDTHEAKVRLLRAAGVHTAALVSELITNVQAALSRAETGAGGRATGAGRG
ncbi:MAG: succinate--CoA ligase subunit alpha [Candidatus Lambdaproteobacteria bacterium]|nr:succinate--CoA ligase subunit alpha [Candidatus Lambdaproteobacteria bacterium]